MNSERSNNCLRRAAFSLLFVGLLSSCGGGGGGDITLTTDSQGADPVILEVPVAYIRRPASEDTPDLRNPLEFQPGAELFVRDRAATTAEDFDVSALIADIVAAEEGVPVDMLSMDIKGLEASFDGNTLVFSVLAVPEPVDQNLELSTWNLWTYDIALREANYVVASRIKRNEGVEAGGGHDLAPHFLPDDRIVFSSTRQVASQARQLNEGRVQLFAGLDESGRTPAAVLHLYDPLQRGEEFQQISFNLSHDLDPTVLSTGEIIFSRWNNTASDHISLFRIEPSGMRLSPLYGFHTRASGTDGSPAVFSQPRELDDGSLVSVLRSTTSESLGGDIVVLNTTDFADENTPSWNSAGAGGSGQESLTSNDIRTDDTLSPGGQFGSVYPLRDGTGRLLVTWSDCRVIDEANPASFPPCSLRPDSEEPAPPLYGGWVYDPGADTQRPVIIPQEGFVISELIAAEPRDFASLVPLPENFNSELAQQGQGQLLIDSVYDMDGQDGSPQGIAQHAQPATPAHQARPARFLRIVQPVPLPDRDIFEVPRYALGVAGGMGFREILGYVPVEPDGSVSVTLPALRPFTFDVLNARGRRIGARHNYWLQLGEGEVLQCAGCHDHGSGLPHGLLDAQPDSSNPGAIDLNGGLGFVRTRSDELFAVEPGQSMAQVWNLHRPEGNSTATDRELTLSPFYTDEWHRLDLAADATIDNRDYNNQWPDIAPGRNIVVPSFDPEQPSRIVINYIDHIQPIWERTRDARNNSEGTPIDTCIGCHSTSDLTPVPPGQLDLTSVASDIDPDHYRSYRELLSLDQEQWINENDTAGDRVRICTRIDQDGNPFIVNETIGLRAPLVAGSANASTRFFGCFEGGNCGVPATPPLPAECIEGDGTIVPPTLNTVDHQGLLSEIELHLLSEWLDIGGQYFNNPFDDRLVE
jgi:Hydrazine synthase alpha subunit middle domain